jgi:hypothetical protein
MQNPELQRSHLFLNSDRYVIESEVLAKLESGAGLLGLRKVNFE